MDEDHENNSNNNNNKTAGDNSVDEPKSNTSKDIKKGMDRYEAKIKSGEAPTGDATRSDE
jgi:hypothetical protein